MQIQNHLLKDRGTFYIEVEGEHLAELVFRLAPGILTIDHTEVDKRLKGKNAGNLLVQHAAEYARANNLKIIPICPFARSVFEKRKEEFIDVLYNAG